MKQHDLSTVTSIMFAAVILIGVGIAYAEHEEDEDHDDDDDDLELSDDRVLITVNGTEFYATLYDNDAAEDLWDILPQTLTMTVYGNLIFDYLDSNLEDEEMIPQSLAAGDIVLYGESELMIFFDDYTNSALHEYSMIGVMDDASGLEDAINSSDDVTVTIERYSSDDDDDDD